jgi:hypothetical protein
VEKLQNSGGYVACSIQFFSKQEESSSHNSLSDESSDIEHLLPPLKSGAGALAKYLSLVENDSLDDLSNRVGDLLTPNNIHQTGSLSRKQSKNNLSPNTNNEVGKWKGEFKLTETKWKKNTYASDSAGSLGGYEEQY